MVPLQFGVPAGPELLPVLGVIFLILPFGMAYWVSQNAEADGNETSRSGRPPSAG